LTAEIVSGRDRRLGDRLRRGLAHQPGPAPSRIALAASERTVGYVFATAKAQRADDSG
jgi:hypothetical protein